MKKIIGLSLLLTGVIILGGCSLYGGTTTTPPPAVTTPQNTAQVSPTESSSINIKNFSFNPATLTIKKGATVTWTNNDSAPHQVNSNSFNSESLSNGQNFSFTFNDAGTFDYHCSIHPSMIGKIIVE